MTRAERRLKDVVVTLIAEGVYPSTTVLCHRLGFNMPRPDLNGREMLVLGSLAVAVLWMGIYPKPFTDVMHASVNELLRHVALPKI